MPYFQVDDCLPFHRKVLRAGNEAMGAWVRAGAWSSCPANLTEGWIPAEVCAQIAPPRVWTKLRAAGLTEDPSDGRGGEQLHDFITYNPTADAVRAKRKAWAQKKANQRAKPNMSPGDIGGDTDEDTSGESPSSSRGSPPLPGPCPSSIEEERDVGEAPGDVPGPLRGAGVSGLDGSGDDPADDGAKQFALPLGEPPVAAPRPRGRDLPSEAHALFVKGWRAARGKGKAPVLDDKRRKLIRDRAKDFDAEDILDAARGAWCPSWQRENGHNAIEQVFANAKRVEQYRDIYRATLQPDGGNGGAAEPPEALRTRYDRLPQAPDFREPRAETIPALHFGDDS